MTSSAPPQHRAAMIPAKGSPLTITNRPTPTPGPGEVLIRVHAVALNLVDYYQRDLGIPPIPHYPTVLGSDASGTIESHGPNVPSGTPAPGTRVVALASGFWKGSLEDYGAFQEYVLAPAECVAVLPDGIPFEEGAVLPVAVLTAWNGWCAAGLGFETNFASQSEVKEAVIVWGGSSSVGSFALQTAKSMGLVVYTTASPRHHGYMKELGASRVFDYNEEDVVNQIIEAVKADGVKMRFAYGAVPDSLLPILDVLKVSKGEDDAKIAYAPRLPDDAPTVEGIEMKWAYPPMEPNALRERFGQTFNVWLTEALKADKLAPSPHVRVVDGGLDGLNDALDILKEGVSGTKIVLKL